MKTRMLVLLAALFCFSLAGTPFAARAGDPTTAELLQEVLTKRDACDVRGIFGKLKERKDEEAFAAIVRGYEVLLEVQNRLAVLYCLKSFADADEKLQLQVIAFLDQALKEPTKHNVFAVAGVLAEFGPLAQKELFYHLERYETFEVREKLLRGVLDLLIKEGGAHSLEHVLVSFGVPDSGTQEQLREALRALYGATDLRRTTKLLDRPGVLPSNARSIIEAFGEIPGGEVDALLRKLADASNDELRALVAAALVLRDGDAATKLLRERFKKEKAAGPKGQALKGLLARPKTAKDAAGSVKRAASSKDEEEREMAAIALGSAGIGDIDLVLPLLADKLVKVRKLALQAVLARREKAGISALIERLDVEEDKQQVDIHDALRKLTGEDFGDRPHRWRTWWSKEGQTFVLPDAKGARRKTQSRDLERMRRNRGSQYGLNPKGKGIYFVLDVSDSMNGIFELAKNKEDKWETFKHIDILSEEMVGVIERMKDEQLFNIIRFGTSFEKMAPQLVTLNEAMRVSSTKFVQRKETLGATALHDALEAAFADKAMDTIYLISDGDPKGGTVDDPDELLRVVKKWNRRDKVKIHCISLQSYKSVFLQSLAEQSGGEYHHVPPPG